MNPVKADEIRQSVRASYSEVAEASDAGDCCGEQSSCCGVSSDSAINALVSTRLGYSEQDLDTVPAGADMGLGCGNPRAIAGIRAGETVLDLGSGGGFDCFLAAAETGVSGKVIGVDMTPSMISKARPNAANGQVQPGRIPPRRNRKPAAGERQRRCHHFELRDQPVAGQAPRVSTKPFAYSRPAVASRFRTSSPAPNCRTTSARTCNSTPAAWPAPRRSMNSSRYSTQRLSEYPHRAKRRIARIHQGLGTGPRRGGLRDVRHDRSRETGR